MLKPLRGEVNNIYYLIRIASVLACHEIQCFQVLSLLSCVSHCKKKKKTNKVILPAPLQPIPVIIGEPSERILIDCVGPLP